jgi:outer membrane protein insertion porin family
MERKRSAPSDCAKRSGSRSTVRSTKKREKGRQKIVETYKGRGYNDITVEFRVDPIEEKRGTARVVYTINEGLKGAIRSVQFEGNAHFSAKVLRKQMKTRGKTMIAFFDKSGRLDEVQLQQDLDSVKEFYQNHGYIDVEVKDVRKERPSGPIVITISIVQGPLYHTEGHIFRIHNYY